ncbi:uncharacterized protein LOC130451269 [Diorhabda sublineata]|uniref:uncharacterized protein LOC130451269 n=1 Tax=Diorhabda sublineata TaxID=1163346 RepID=UPI0024E06FCC|nr:uncharacterized protein LOC130451269 [Diorhabda sublineata]
MGNNGSQNVTITEPHSLDKLVHSYPRTQPLHSKQHYQHKVLPERDARLKLRPTGNGEIIQSGGTISGRQFRLTRELKDTLNRNVSENCKRYSSDEEKDCSREKENSRKTARHGQKLSNNQSSQQGNITKNYEDCSSSDVKDLSRKVFLHRVKQKQSNNLSSQQIKYFASEPDLRYACKNVNNDCQDRRLRKKYKAPSPPKPSKGSDNSQSITENLLNPGLPIRKARLFKTRAETKKQSSQLNETTDDYLNNNHNTDNITNNDKVRDKLKTLNLPETKLNSKEFVKELKDATRRLRHVELEKEELNNTRTKLNTLDPNVPISKDLTKKLLLTIENHSNSKNSFPQCSRGEASGKESTTPDMSPSPTSRGIAAKDCSKQLFYFGMNKNVTNENQPNNGMYQNFTSKSNEDNSSESDLSSDIDSDENDTFRSGIDLQLRPILPKKQLEIPRFSPSAAWRLLSINNDNTNGTMISDDVPVLLEDHIEKFARPPPPLVNAGQRSSNDKSGDSGISGDAPDAANPISYCFDDITSANDTNRIINTKKMSMKYLNKPERVSWTPQQDLGDDTSTEEDGVNDKTFPQKSRAYLGPHTFSLSLPRDNRLAAYMIEKNSAPQYSGMQKFKKSLSGVLGRKVLSDSSFAEENNANWFFSKSAPNSLTHTFHSLERCRMQDAEDLLYPTNVNASSRLIYLPEIDLGNEKPRNFNNKYSVYSKSCDDISLEVHNYYPEPLQDPARTDESSWKLEKKPKKYTFQSTIRQIEKKRLSDKLSREAEKRERKRLRELEAMQKVEEEFQKKRAREKADIRKQLRLFSLDENSGRHSIPHNFEIDNKERRSEPDGAFSSVSSSSSSPKHNGRTIEHSKMSKFENKPSSAFTRELSEYRQPQRNYKDYNSNIKFTSDKGYSRQTTIYPQVKCNMPKAKGPKTKEDHNYRKEFAAGIRILTTTSTHSEDSQNYSTKRNKLTGSRRSYNRHLVSS